MKPLHELLQDSVTEEEVQRVWRGIRRRRSTSAWRVERRHALGFAAAALLGLVALVFALRTPASWRGPLLEANGRPVNSLGAEAASSTWLADGSRIDLGPGAALEVLDNDESSFVCVLRRGRGTFAVKPGGPRRWRVEAGALRVEVIGTRFTVDRGRSRVSVDVDHGTVLVRGDRVPDGVQKLTAGSRLIIDIPDLNGKSVATGRAAESAPVASSAAPTAATLPPSGAATSGTEPASAATPTAHVPSANVDWLQVADEQRRHGNLKGAIASLRAASAEGDSSRRAIAAFTLGKLLLDGAGRPSEAAQAFRSCLRMSPPAAMAEDASARLVEAQARAGHAEAALRSARDYERRYPNGRRLADVRRWAKED